MSPGSPRGPSPHRLDRSARAGSVRPRRSPGRGGRRGREPGSRRLFRASSPLGEERAAAPPVKEVQMVKGDMDPVALLDARRRVEPGHEARPADFAVRVGLGAQRLDERDSEGSAALSLGEEADVMGANADRDLAALLEPARELLFVNGYRKSLPRFGGPAAARAL